MKTKLIKTERPGDRRANGRFAARQVTAQRMSLESAESSGVAFRDNRSTAVAQRKLQQAVDGSPVQLAQAEQLSGGFGFPVQRVEDEEELQMMAAPAAVQREAMEEEEPLQGRFETVQRQGAEEEEELLQGEFEPVQRQGVEEEDELLQGKFETVQRQGLEEEELLQGKFGTVQRQGGEDEEELLQGRFESRAAPVQLEAGAGEAENRTGMPVQLKAGLERLSGMDLSDVRVHTSSPKPAQLNALAYAQGKDIHVGPGQEKHMPHEAWHVVQQRRGRVKPTKQLQGVAINDTPALEREADVMGEKARHVGSPGVGIAMDHSAKPCTSATSVIQREGDEDEDDIYRVGQIDAAEQGIKATKDVKEGNIPRHIKSLLIKEQGHTASGGPLDTTAGLLGYDPVPGPAAYAAAPSLFINDHPGSWEMTRSAQSSDIDSRSQQPRGQVLGGIAKGAAFFDALGDLATIGTGLRDWVGSKKALKNVSLSKAEKRLLKRSLRTGQKETAKGALSGTKTGLTIAANFGANVAGAAGVVGAGLSFIGGARNLRKGYRAYKRSKELKKVINQNDRKVGLNDAVKKFGPPPKGGVWTNSKDMRTIAEYAQKKNRRKMRRSLLSGTGAVLSGAGGTILGLGALGVGGAIAATPVGWALAAAGGALGLGVGAWKLGRWAYKKHRRNVRKRKEKPQDKKYDMAFKLLKAYKRNDQMAIQIVNALNLSQKDQHALTRGQEEFGAALLERKLASW